MVQEPDIEYATMRKAILFILAWISFAAAEAEERATINAIEVKVERTHAENGPVFQIHAQGVIAASPEKVWRVLTDYQRLAEFVPNLQTSTVMSRSDKDTVIDQTGTAGFFFYKKAIHIVVRASETPKSRIDVNLVSGNMRQYAVRWDLQAMTFGDVQGTSLTYSGALAPDFFVPSLIGTSVMQADVKKMLEAVITEILKQP